MWLHKESIEVFAFELRKIGSIEYLETLPSYLKFQGICCWQKLVAMVIFLKLSVSCKVILNVATHMSL